MQSPDSPIFLDLGKKVFKDFSELFLISAL